MFKILPERYQKKAKMNMDIIILPIAFILVVTLMTLTTSFKFLSATNVGSMLLQMPELGLFSLAMMLAMTIGGIDLSVISTANLSGVIMASLLTKIIPKDLSSSGQFMYFVLIVLIGLSVSIILGAINGILVAYVEISPVLTTLSTMILFEGMTLVITKGRPISGLPEMFTKLGNGSFFHIPIPFIIFVIVAFFVRVIVKYSPMGKYQVLLGSNKEALEYAGVDIRKITVKTYMFIGLLAGLASVIMLSRINAANARFGTSYLLLSVLITVLGGTDPDGGYVRVGGVIVALFTMQALNSGINILGVTPFVSTALWGILLIATMFYRKNALKKKDKWLSDIAKNKN